MNKSIIAFAAVIGMSASVLHAQALLLRSDQRAEAYARRFNPGGSGNSGVSVNLFGHGLDFSAIENRTTTISGFSGNGYAQEAVTFSANNPGIGGMFHEAVLEACTSAEIFTSAVRPAGNHTAEEAYGLARGVIEFNLAQPTDWTWNGVSQGQSFNTGSYHAVAAAFLLEDINTGTQYVNMQNATVNGVGDFFIPFFFTGTLPAGDYRLGWLHESFVTGGITNFGNFSTAVGGAPLISCIPSTFTLIIPTPAAACLVGMGLLPAMRRRRA